jgi:hypothetical protein
MRSPSKFRATTLMLAAVLVAGVASPAAAAADPVTRVVDCRSGSCLLVSGHRENAASAVSINGHAVAVEGKRDWRIRLPVETVREWSVPLARTITVTSVDAVTLTETSADVDLPIGLLGHAENLAALVISIK